MSITLLIVSVIAGLLTVLAPCVLPLLPIILGVSGVSGKQTKNILWVVAGLSASIFVFTLLLRTAIRFSVLSFLDESVLTVFSAIIIGVFGLSLLFPKLWTWVSVKSGFEKISQKMLDKSPATTSARNSLILGASLGPVFTSCSPTYFVIIGLLASQSSAFDGVILLLCYILGLAVSMLSIGLLGQALMKPLRRIADPKGVFKNLIGLAFIVLAISIGTGQIKDIETALLELPFFQTIIEFEETILT